MGPPPTCPRCASALGMTRWCATCGYDLRAELGPDRGPEARLAEWVEQRWLESHPATAPTFLPPSNAAPLVTALAPGPPAEPYRDQATSARLTMRWLWVSCVLAVASLALDGYWLQRHGSGGGWNLDEIVSLTRLIETLALIQLGVLLVGGVIFIVWFQRAYLNLAALSREPPRWSRAWAIGGWFIPIASLVIPKQIANDLWRAGDESARVPSLLHWWWACWVIGGVVAFYAGSAAGRAVSLGQLRDAIWVDAASQVLTACCAVAAIRVVDAVGRRQGTRATSLALEARGGAL